MSPVPSGEDFHAASARRAKDFLDFTMAAGEFDPPATEREQKLIDLGIVAGVTSAVEELASLGLIGGQP